MKQKRLSQVSETAFMDKLNHYNMNEIASLARGCFNRTKRRLTASLQLEQKRDLFPDLQDSKTFHIQNSAVSCI